jgi:hypothetical protein
MASINLFNVGYQIYLIPTIKFTHSKKLNGYRAIEFIWLNWGIEIAIN